MKFSELNINTSKALKFSIIGYSVILVIGIVLTCIFGVNLDINFKGGTRITYSYTGTIDNASVNTVITENLGSGATASYNSGMSGSTQQLVVSVAGNSAISPDTQNKLTAALKAKFPSAALSLYDSNTVSPNIAGSFFAKSLVTVLIAGVIVTAYVWWRFRKIGGLSAALMAYLALILDCIVAFLACTAFRLPVDSNLIAVILTLLGYSLNDTIVIYDRIREERKLNPKEDVAATVERSVNTVKTRTIITTITTLLAVITIIVVSEIFGLTSLRSFAIPMTFGLVSGCISSLFISCPLWAIWKKKTAFKKKK